MERLGYQEELVEFRGSFDFSPASYRGSGGWLVKRIHVNAAAPCSSRRHGPGCRLLVCTLFIPVGTSITNGSWSSNCREHRWEVQLSGHCIKEVYNHRLRWTLEVCSWWQNCKGVGPPQRSILSHEPYLSCRSHPASPSSSPHVGAPNPTSKPDAGSSEVAFCAKRTSARSSSVSNLSKHGSHFGKRVARPVFPLGWDLMPHRGCTRLLGLGLPSLLCGTKWSPLEQLHREASRKLRVA